MNKSYIKIIILLLVAGLFFFGGMEYGKSKTSSTFQRGDIASRFANMQDRNNGNSFMGGRITGEIIGKDDTSITISLPDGGSKVILLSDTTTIAKSAEGSLDDLVEGENVAVSGQEDDSGVYIATSIQIGTGAILQRMDSSTQPGTQEE